jgi:hypothetical protein
MTCTFLWKGEKTHQDMNVFAYVDLLLKLSSKCLGRVDMRGFFFFVIVSGFVSYFYEVRVVGLDLT